MAYLLDSLFYSHQILSCSKATCTSSIMNIGNAAVEARKSDLILEHAKDFLEQYFTSIKRWAFDNITYKINRISDLILYLWYIILEINISYFLSRLQYIIYRPRDAMETGAPEHWDHWTLSANRNGTNLWCQIGLAQFFTLHWPNTMVEVAGGCYECKFMRYKSKLLKKYLWQVRYIR